MVSSAMVTRKAATLGTLVVNFAIETMCFTCRSIRCARISSSDVSELRPGYVVKVRTDPGYVVKQCPRIVMNKIFDWH